MMLHTWRIGFHARRLLKRCQSCLQEWAHASPFVVAGLEVLIASGLRPHAAVQGWNCTVLLVGEKFWPRRHGRYAMVRRVLCKVDARSLFDDFLEVQTCINARNKNHKQKHDERFCFVKNLTDCVASTLCNAFGAACACRHMKVLIYEGGMVSVPQMVCGDVVPMQCAFALGMSGGPLTNDFIKSVCMSGKLGLPNGVVPCCHSCAKTAKRIYIFNIQFHK